MAVPLLQFVFLAIPSSTNIGKTNTVQFIDQYTCEVELFFSSSVHAPGSALATHFTAVPFVSDSGGEVSHELYVTHRHQHYPVLHVRSAVVEDADDLTPIFNQCSTNVQEQYGMFSVLLLQFYVAHDVVLHVGEFFLAELIACQDDAHQTFVADVSLLHVSY